MNHKADEPPTGEDRFWFEYTARDFPFYNGLPKKINGARWWLVMIGVLAGFLVLSYATIFEGPYLSFIPALLFPGIPLICLAMVTGHYWKELFYKVKWRDIKWMILFALLNIIVTLSVSFLVKALFGTNPNAAVSQLGEMERGDQILFLVRTIPQLFGEEVLTILPFLAMMYLFYSRFKMSRKQSIVLAWIGACIIFGAVHLPTYDWNFVQCFVIIGIARLILLIPYIKTKNIWVSTGTHIINDWIIFLVTIGASG